MALSKNVTLYGPRIGFPFYNSKSLSIERVPPYSPHRYTSCAALWFEPALGTVTNTMPSLLHLAVKTPVHWPITASPISSRIYVICVCLHIVVSWRCCVFVLFCLYSSCFQFLWIVYFCFVLRYSLTFIYLTLYILCVLLSSS